MCKLSLWPTREDGRIRLQDILIISENTYWVVVGGGGESEGLGLIWTLKTIFKVG